MTTTPRHVLTHQFNTVFGIIRTASTEAGLALIALPNESQSSFKSRVDCLAAGGEVRIGGETNFEAEKQLKAYFSGELQEFRLPLDVTGTPFQRRVLAEVARIPYGQTRTYKDIAEIISKPKAARAVGSANARNLLPLVIPCHRVVAGQGLGGYGGGLEMKERLLQLEGAR
jgi:O-6-methylguanine DNA methyltransferase